MSSDLLAGHVAEPFLETARACWRGGWNFAYCCRRDLQEGNPDCWNGGGNIWSYEHCCLPALPKVSSNFFEDVNCDRAGSRSNSWLKLRPELERLVDDASFGLLGPARGTGELGRRILWLRQLMSSFAGPPGECPLGRLSATLGILLLCLIENTDDEVCAPAWTDVAAAVRDGANDIVLWMATTWPVFALLLLLSRRVGSPTPESGCLDASGVNWPFLLQHAQTADVIIDQEVMREMARHSQLAGWLDDTCKAGEELVATIKMHWCSQTELACASTSMVWLNWKIWISAQSGEDMASWVSQGGHWNLPFWQIQLLSGLSRHRFALGYTQWEMESLGLAGSEQGHVCTDLKADMPEARIVPAMLPVRSYGLERCRSWCTELPFSNKKNSHASLDEEDGRWLYAGVMPGEESCMCARHVPLRDCPQRSGDTHAEDTIVLTKMTDAPRPDTLLHAWLRGEWSEASHPILSGAAESLHTFNFGATVFVSMVFGHMASFLPAFSVHLEDLSMKNVILYVLDDNAHKVCRKLSRSGFPRYCLRGSRQGTLQKYEVVLTYLSLGKSVFWFDFDSFWLQNPEPYLASLEVSERTFPPDDIAKAFGLSPAADADILAAVDADSPNQVMNAFFWIRYSLSSVQWLVALMNWMYRRPHAHDQVAFGLFLGVGPLVDQEPLPRPPKWAPLDPNVFANAARFAGLGYWGQYEDLILFHFFDGWNSNQPGDFVEAFATPVYQGIDMFETLYFGNESARRSLVELSRIDPVDPNSYKDARHADSLGQGVVTSRSDPILFAANSE